MHHPASKALLSLCVVSLLGACASTGEPTDTQSAADTSAYTREDSAGLQGFGQGETEADAARAIDELDQARLSKRVLYFDFDASAVRAEYEDVLAAHARHLRQNPDVIVQLDGHADERGTREYNMALGERRSISVKRTLMMMGVPPEQLRTRSFGEEQPAVLGRGESSYSQNRRVELNYPNKGK